jgi:hypothetical protein
MIYGGLACSKGHHINKNICSMLNTICSFCGGLLCYRTVCMPLNILMPEYVFAYSSCLLGFTSSITCVVTFEVEEN